MIRKMKCQWEERQWVKAIRKVRNLCGDEVEEVHTSWNVGCKEVLDTGIIGIEVVCGSKMKTL